MILYLCEKPSQAADIARVLGCRDKQAHYFQGECLRVTWCFGHLLTLAPPEHYHPQYKTWSFEALPILPKEWHYLPVPETQHQLQAVGECLSVSHQVVIATDADREGELIAREVLEYFGYKGYLSRLWLSALDETSIKLALTCPRSAQRTYPLYQAALARQKADWLVGMNFSRALTLRLRQKQVYSVGRVQTPTLRLVADREDLIANFQAEVQTDLVADFASTDGVALQGVTLRDVGLKPPLSSSALVVRKTVSAHKTPPPLAFTLSELQKMAGLLFQFSAQHTLDVAQSLYEKHKAISYPRTDCAYLPLSQFANASRVLSQIRYFHLPAAHLTATANAKWKSPVWDDTQLSAHHGLLPILNAGVDPHLMSADEKRIYNLICENYVRQFMGEHETRTLRLVVMADETRFIHRIEEDLALGWRLGLKPAPLDFDFGSRSPWDLEVGEPLHLIDSRLVTRRLPAPRLYRDGDLIDVMKRTGPKGLGTEATRSGMIETLIKRDYLVRENGELKTTKKARRLLALAPHALQDPQTTAQWESWLEQIAQDDTTPRDFLQAQQEWIEELMKILLCPEPNQIEQLPPDW